MQKDPTLPKVSLCSVVKVEYIITIYISTATDLFSRVAAGLSKNIAPTVQETQIHLIVAPTLDLPRQTRGRRVPPSAPQDCFRHTGASWARTL